jgi:hypothetical protein
MVSIPRERSALSTEETQMNAFSINTLEATTVDVEAAIQSFKVIDRLIAVAGMLLLTTRQAATVLHVAAFRFAQA